MSDDGRAFLELAASYEAALEAAYRSLTTAQELTVRLLDGQHPPRDVVRAYANQVAKDSTQLAELLARVAWFKPQIQGVLNV